LLVALLLQKGERKGKEGRERESVCVYVCMMALHEPFECWAKCEQGGEKHNASRGTAEALLASCSLLRAKDPKVQCAQVCITVAGLVLQGIAGSEHWPLDVLVCLVCMHARH